MPMQSNLHIVNNRFFLNFTILSPPPQFKTFLLLTRGSTCAIYVGSSINISMVDKRNISTSTNCKHAFICFFRLVSKTIFTRNNTRNNNFIFPWFNWWGKISYFTCIFFRLLLPSQIIRATVYYYRIRFELYSWNYIALHAFRFSTRYWFYKNVSLLIWLSWPIDAFNHRIFHCSNFPFLLKLLVVFSTFLVLKVVYLLLVRMESFLLFVVGTLGMYYLKTEYLNFHVMVCVYQYSLF